MNNMVYFKNSFFSFFTQLCRHSLLIGGGMVLFASFSAQALETEERNATVAHALLRTPTTVEEVGGVAPNPYPPATPRPEPSDERINSRKVLQDGDIPCKCCAKKYIIRKPWAITGLATISLAFGVVGFFIIHHFALGNS